MTRKVIDVSGWQADLNYDEVVKAGVQGVIIKISEGLSPDRTYWQHLNNVKARGLDWGVYCYSQAIDTDMAQAEANEVLYLLKGEKPALGIWMDFEAVNSLNSPDPTGICSKFISYLNGQGYYAGIYGSLSTLTNVINVRALANYVPYWCAQYNRVCNFKDYYPDYILKGWQYSDAEYIGGINVDMNEWYD